MMSKRRDVLLGGLALLGAGTVSNPVFAAASYFAGTAIDNGVTFRATNFAMIDKRWRRQVVKYFSSEPIGTVVVDTRNHFLYLIMENKTAIRYGVGVGRDGFKWFGRATVDQKSLWASLDAASRHAQASSRTAGIRRWRLAEKSARAPRDVSASLAMASIPAIVFMARSNRAASARTLPAAASVCSTRTPSTSTSAARSERPCRSCRILPIRPPKSATQLRSNEEYALMPDQDRIYTALFRGSDASDAQPRATPTEIASVEEPAAVPMTGQTKRPGPRFSKPCLSAASRNSSSMSAGGSILPKIRQRWIPLPRQRWTARQPGSTAIRAGWSSCRDLPMIPDRHLRWKRCRRGVPMRLWPTSPRKVWTPKRMWAKGYGKDREVRDCTDRSCKVQNRRVVANLRTERDAL